MKVAKRSLPCSSGYSLLFYFIFGKFRVFYTEHCSYKTGGFTITFLGKNGSAFQSFSRIKIPVSFNFGEIRKAHAKITGVWLDITML